MLIPGLLHKHQKFSVTEKLLGWFKVTKVTHFRITFHGFERPKTLNTNLCWQNWDESQTQQPVSDRKQLDRQRKRGARVFLWGHSLQFCCLNQTMLTQETLWVTPSPTSPVFVSVYFLPMIADPCRCPLQRGFVLITDLSHCVVFLLFFCREWLRWNQSQEQLANQQHDSSSSQRYKQQPQKTPWISFYCLQTDPHCYWLNSRFFNGAPTQHQSYRACTKNRARYEVHLSTCSNKFKSI